MKITKKITLDFDEEESITLQHIAYLVQKNKSVLNVNPASNDTGQQSKDYYEEETYKKIIDLANKIVEVS